MSFQNLSTECSNIVRNHPEIDEPNIVVTVNPIYYDRDYDFEYSTPISRYVRFQYKTKKRSVIKGGQLLISSLIIQKRSVKNKNIITCQSNTVFCNRQLLCYIVVASRKSILLMIRVVSWTLIKYRYLIYRIGDR